MLPPSALLGGTSRAILETRQTGTYVNFFIKKYPVCRATWYQCSYLRWAFIGQPDLISRSGQHFGLDAWIAVGGAGESDRQVGINRMGKMTPDINPKLTSNPKYTQSRPRRMGKMTQKPIRLVRNRPKSRGRDDRISILNRVGLTLNHEMATIYSF